MSAHADLNRQLAEALGWRCEHVDAPITAICKPPNIGTVTLLPGAYVIFNPAGEPLWTAGCHFAPETAWDYALTYLAPHWSEEAGAALELCEQIARERGYQLVLAWTDQELYSYPPNMAVAAHFRQHRIGPPDHQGYGATPALALARLALAALSAAPD